MQRNTWKKLGLSKEPSDALAEFSIKTIAYCFDCSRSNLSYSPLSLYFALAVIAEGTEGKTQQELLEMLCVKNKFQLSFWCKEIYNMLCFEPSSGRFSNDELKIASSLWLDSKITYNKYYMQAIEEFYYTSAFIKDLRDKETRCEMKNWIKENSKGKISINPQRLNIGNAILFNIVYFNSQWVETFREENTYKDIFYISNDTTIECDFMHKKKYGHGKYGNGYIMSELALKSGRVYIVLPDEGISPQKLLSDSEIIRDIFYNEERYKEMEFGTINWSVPKIKLSSELDCAKLLKKMDISFFLGEEADLSGISNDKIVIDAIEQYTNFSMDEYGVEVASLTACHLKASGRGGLNLDMNLNRPFIYAIFDENDVMITIGICDNPVAN